MKINQILCISKIISTSVLCFGASSAAADDLAELRKELQSLRQEVQQLKMVTQKQQATIESLTAETTVPASDTIAKQQDSSPVTATGTNKSPVPFIPDIGVIADITGSLSESTEDEEGNDRFSVREVELVLGHDIDPYSRLDATITFSDFEEADIEEAYVSYWDLPLDSKARIGRFRPKIGKASAAHRDSLDTTDEPLVVQRYLGVEGLFKTGLELNGFTPLSSDSFTQQLTGGVLEGGVGEDGELFGGSSRHPTLYGHLSNFFEISDLSNFELGGTYLLGSNNVDSELKTNVFGVDATYTYYVTPINKLKFLNEAYFQDRNDSFSGEESSVDSELSEHPWGFYSLIDYRFSERWGVGSRYDYVELIDNPIDNPHDHEHAITGYLTFFQSEFARWRAEYQYAALADGNNDNRFFLQGTFAIGTHKHQLQ